MGHEERPLIALGKALARTQDEQLHPASRDLDPGRERLLHAVARRRERAPTRRRIALSMAFAAAAALLIVLVLLPRRPLHFRAAGGAEGRLGEWIAAPAGEALPLRFSDGTVLALDPEARARVVTVEARGARVVLERGRIEASVVHREGTRWTLDVGPFAVLVTGTRFHVSWTPETEAFRLDLEEGSVRVTGPLVGEPRTVSAGQTLKIACKERRLELTSADPVKAETAVLANQAPPDPPAPEPTIPAIPSAPAPLTARPIESAPRPSFRDLNAQGKYEEAVRAAESEGFASTCDRLGPADLMALADAARFAGKPARAADALRALRRHFPGDPRAATAAFLLGRAAFDQRGAHGEAATWFTTYLAEQPRGSLAGEALGRLFECQQRTGDLASARATAQRYLDAYPTGPNAEQAKSLLAR
jgi:transmembrane sensor